MATYMSDTDLANYTADRYSSSAEQPNISDFEDYDYDYESWIHYGDYWIKPDGTISTQPPVAPPVEEKPTTPKDKLVDESGDHTFSSTWDWTTGTYRDYRDVNNADTTYDGSTVSFSNPLTSTPWNQYFYDQYKEANDGVGNLVYGAGNLYLGSAGVDSGNLSKIGQYGGAILGGTLGSVVGANALPFLGEAYTDWRNQRENEAYKDVLEGLGSTGYYSGRTAGNAYDILSDWYGSNDLTGVSPQNLAYLQSALTLYPSLTEKAFETKGGAADIASFADYILGQQGLAAGGYDLPLNRVQDYVASIVATQNSPNAWISDYGNPATAIQYLTSPGWTPAVVGSLSQAQEDAKMAATLNAVKEASKNYNYSGDGDTSGGYSGSGTAYASSTTGGGLASGTSYDSSKSNDKPDKETGKSGGEKNK